MTRLSFILLCIFSLILITGLAIYLHPKAKTLDIVCYSCGGVIFEDVVDVYDYTFLASGGIVFHSKKNDSWTNLGGDCVVKIMEDK